MYRPLRVLTQDELHAVSGGDGPPTVADFNVVNANGSPLTQAQINQVNSALAYLDQSSAASAALDSFAGHTITLVTNGDDKAFPADGSVQWDPSSGLLFGDNIQSAAMGLIHEIGHQTQPNGNSGVLYYDDLNYAWTTNEAIATLFETQVANQLGEPTRDSYFSVDNMVVTDNPTLHGDFLSAFYNQNAELDVRYTDTGGLSNDYMNEMMAAFPGTFGNPNVGNTTSDAAFWQDFDSYYGTNIGTSYFDNYYMTDYGYYWENNGFYDTGMGTWYDYGSNTYYYANYGAWVDPTTYMYLMYGGC